MLRTWKLKDQDVGPKFQDELESDTNIILESVEDIWKHLKSACLKLLKIVRFFKKWKMA